MKQNLKTKNIISLVVVIAILVLVNYIAGFVFARIDLTSDKRYTLSETTKTYLEELNDIVYVKIYLNDDDLPYGFTKLKNSVKETLDEFKIYGEDNIEYDFINPTESGDKKTINEIYRQLYDKGLTPTNIQEKDESGASSQKIIFPGALVSYMGNEIPLDFVVDNPSFSPEQNLNNSTQDLEYKFANSIRKLKTIEKKRIAFIYGHGEFDEQYVADITSSLLEFYNVSRVKIDGKLDALNGYDLIIIAGPDSAYDKYDKFIIDQFIMQGGKSMWFVDPVVASLDSLATGPYTLALIKDIGIRDILFNYGVRVEANLIQDIQCGVIPLNTSIVGVPPKFIPAPWVYHPLISSKNNHPINKNLNLIKTEFVSTITYVGEDDSIIKTTLLSSSKFSRLINAPVRISLELLKSDPDPKRFTKSFQPIATLLEGEFKSLFKNRLTPDIESSKEIDFKDKGENTQMIIVSDADIIKNKLRRGGTNFIPYPLGFDRYTGQTYGNKEFVMNCVNYLLDDSGLMDVRQNNFQLRMLDKVKVSNDKTIWQIINTILPIIFIVLIGIVANIIRRKRFAK